jgi:hypothetical protein
VIVDANRCVSKFHSLTLHIYSYIYIDVRTGRTLVLPEKFTLHHSYSIDDNIWSSTDEKYAGVCRVVKIVVRIAKSHAFRVLSSTAE